MDEDNYILINDLFICLFIYILIYLFIAFLLDVLNVTFWIGDDHSVYHSELFLD